MAAAPLIKDLATLDQTRDQQFIRYLSPYLIPSNCSQANASALADFLDREQALSTALNTQMLKTAQREQRCADLADYFLKQQLQP